MAELITSAPDGSVSRLRLGEKGAVVGRLPECDLILSDPQSSRRHCRITPGPTGWLVEDLRSVNGTILNGKPLSTPTPLRDGDTVVIGDTKIVFAAGEPPRPAAARMPAPSHRTSVVEVAEDIAEASLSVNFVHRAGGAFLSQEEACGADVGKLQRATTRLKLLIDVGRAMGSTLDPHALLDTCLDKLFEVFLQADRGIVVLYGPDGSLPTMLGPEERTGATLDRRMGAITKVKHRQSGAVHDLRVKLSRTVLDQVRRERQSVLVTDDGSVGAAGLSMQRFELKSLMCAPLVVGSEDLGIIQLETKSRTQAFTPDDLELLTAVAGQVAVVIRNAELALNAAAAAAQRENLSRFLSPQLVDEVVHGKLDMSLGGKETRGTIFFSDIVGFTRLAARMRPQDVVTLLNRYFKVMQNVIFHRGGSIDKCAGDAIMAHWGVIGDVSDAPARAVAAAVEMQVALFAFNRDEAQKREIALPPAPLGHGIGLNTGTVCAGNIGSDRKIEFTVIGDGVNLASRMESSAGRFQTFVSQQTCLEILDRVFAIRMPDFPAKNVDHPVAVLSVRGIVPPDGIAPEDGVFRVDQVLFAMPCRLKPVSTSDGPPVAAMLTRLRPGRTGDAKLVLMVERPVSANAEVVVEWVVPEKPSLPEVRGFVERCWQPPAHSGGGTRTIHDTALTLEPGTLLVHVMSLPPEVAEWGPGVLLPSDLTSHEQIVRA